MRYELPKSLVVNGNEYSIRSDFRDVLRIIEAMNDPDLEDAEKVYVSMFILYEDFQSIPEDDYKEAFEKLLWFIDNGEDRNDSRKAQQKVLDFEQDWNLLIPAVNRIAGRDIREAEYVHWWTFLGYYMEIGECTFSTVLSIRSKRAKGKKLEKWEQEFFNSNKDIVLIRQKESEQEKEEKARLEAMLG